MDSTLPPPSSRRFIAVTMCLTAAAGTALVWTNLRPAVAPVAPPAVFVDGTVPDTLSILAALPRAAATDAGKARAAAVARVQAAPQQAAAWVTLGDALAQEQRDTGSQDFYNHAEAAYLQALRLDAKDTNAMTGLAWVLGGRHLFDHSMEWANKALAIRPELPAPYGILGDAALELGQYDDAFEHYQKMMDLRPDLSSWSRGAHLLWITGDKSKAMWLMERALKAGAPYAENTAWCRARLAMMLYHDGALLPASQIIEPALAAGSRNTPILVAASRIAAARGDLSAAKKHSITILESGPQHDALVMLGDLCAAEGDKEAAEKYYQRVEALHASLKAAGTDDPLAMARFLADHDRNLTEALRLADPAKFTKNVLHADTVAWVYFKNGDNEKAVAAMKRALSRNTPDAELRYHAGMIAAAAGDKTSARKHLQAALSFNSQFSLLQAPIAVKTLDSLASVATASVEPSP